MSKQKNTKFKVYSKLGLRLTNHPKIFSNKLSSKKWNNLQSIHRRPRKETEYGVMLQAKQRLSCFYGLLKDNQLTRKYVFAKKFHGNQTINFIKLIERRLDVILYRCKISPSFHQLRQLIQHGHILLNGSSVNKSSSLLSVGDCISIKQGSYVTVKSMYSKYSEQTSNPVKQNIKGILDKYPLLVTPNYIEFNPELLEGRLVMLPETSDILYPMDPQLTHLMEYYKYKKKI